ncbi:LysR family transcriptional regulator [Nostoc sp. 2RC]|jgi:DNA-binding transcriptional LysR family regulator|uniref:LysR family transcriptional regulator n=1 Tax=Nostoc sp. 2RC TaxID=2485484 RepID=UPI0016270504|nr:LysR family transcriptional regulator [Nostoc sp. 2RC]MBC1241638.1 LysR family transcriptional regulator [Nostoc sp. 2RC]
MNLERLERFVFLATLKNEAGQKDINISHAAEQLHIPQPHLSKQIKKLEEELGIELFVRKPRLELTPYGQVFLQEAQHLLEQVERIQISAKQASQGEIGRLTVGISTSISNSLLPNILRVFRHKYPYVDLVLQELMFEDSREKLQDRTLDVDFENWYNLQDIDDGHFLTYEIVTEEPLVMVLPKKHPLSHYPQIQLQDFKAEPFILPCYEKVPALHALIRNACLSAGFQPKVVQEAGWMTTILGLVAGEIGVTLLPANVMNLQRIGVVYRKIQGQSPIFKMAIAWRRDNQSKVLANFLKVVREVSCK